ncbi:MAG: lysophospholipid acyltransferase family protein [Faecousia sp.]
MMIGENREAVIANIAEAAQSGAFYSKVELNDPELTPEQGKAIISGYLQSRNKTTYKCKAFMARRMANAATKLLNRDTEIVGYEKAAAVTGGAILTCNHFSPVDNTVVRHLTRKLGKKRINIISQQSNFAMGGTIGFLMNYADTIPLSDEYHYLLRQLPEILEERLSKGEFVLIYPEQEMWFNYRKPRPPKKGAYHFAAKLHVPVISCFIEMRDEQEMDAENFRKVRYTLHILDVLYPDPEKSVHANSAMLCEKDYALKKEAYERIYGKPLNYAFEPSDIAGWTGENLQ